MTKLEELKKEAADLGVKFSPNIGEEKLSAKIEEFYVSQETSKVKVKEEVKSEKKVEVEKVEEAPRRLTMREQSNIAEKLARETHIVTITDNDQRENNLTTTVSVNCGNDYFDLGTRRIPLNLPVELEQGFINVLKEIRIPAHVTDPKTKETYTTVRNRYSISYDDDLRVDE